MIYFLVSHDGSMCKIGHSTDVAKRFRQHTSSYAGWAFYAAICGAKTDEAEVHRHFDRLLIPGATEQFHLKDDLVDYLEWLGTRAWAACSLDELDDAYEFDGRWPWSPRQVEPDDAQQSLGFDDLIVPGVRKPRTRSARVLATIRSDSDEWYTPRIYVEAARRVMGGIDLDPATCALANMTVRAPAIYTRRDDGLAYPWHGRVWLNPPYGGVNAQFVDHLLREHAAGRVEQAVLCLNSHATDTIWFQPLWDYPVCLTHHRVRFVGGQRDKTPGEVTPTTGTAFVYVGPNVARFACEFSQFGPILRCAQPATCTAQDFRRRIAAGDDWAAA